MKYWYILLLFLSTSTFAQRTVYTNPDGFMIGADLLFSRHQVYQIKAGYWHRPSNLMPFLGFMNSTKYVPVTKSTSTDLRQQFQERWYSFYTGLEWHSKTMESKFGGFGAYANTGIGIGWADWKGVKRGQSATLLFNPSVGMVYRVPSVKELGIKLGINYLNLKDPVYGKYWISTGIVANF